MDLLNIDLGYLSFFIFFASLLLWSIYTMIYGIYKITFWEKAQGKIIKFRVLSKVRRGPYTLSVIYTDSKGQEQIGEVKLDKVFSDKLFDDYLNKNPIEIVYKEKTGEIVLRGSKEHSIGFLVITIFLLYIVITIWPLIFKN